ncbi:MAG: hypothetical protein V4534_00290 [Myxococcota bacterium]
MNRIKLILLSNLFVLNVLSAHDALVSLTRGVYKTLQIDTVVEALRKTALISASVEISPDDAIVVGSDGRFYPVAGKLSALVQIECNGRLASNEAVINWAASQYPVQHSYSVIGAWSGFDGNVTCSLMGIALFPEGNASFAVGATSNLYITIIPNTGSMRVSGNLLRADSRPYQFDVKPDQTPLPSYPALSVTTGATGLSGPVVVFAAGRSYVSDGYYGDAVWFIYNNVNGSGATDRQEVMHTDNDLSPGAESGNAPMYTHAFFPSSENSLVSNVTLAASAEAWNHASGDNTVHYIIGATTTLVSFTGAAVSGRVPWIDGAIPIGNSYYVCVGSDCAWPGCPPITGNGHIFIPSTLFEVPANHSGIVFFSFKSLIQGESNDIGGYLAAQIIIDGNPVGNLAVQQLSTPDSISTRTLSASWSSAENPLGAGLHTISVIVHIVGKFAQLYLGAQLPLVWFG